MNGNEKRPSKQAADLELHAVQMAETLEIVMCAIGGGGPYSEQEVGCAISAIELVKQSLYRHADNCTELEKVLAKMERGET